ncbi:MAG: glycosyltransferase family 2 protein [Anaerolineales bacterium]|nr:glycosyltransferase family 2 protein [Anaerolineales bacterium]
MGIVSAIALGLVLLPVGYLVLLAVAAVRPRPAPASADRAPATRFVIVIPAHDEASVIAATVEHLRQQDYPPELLAIHVVADHCSDNTALLAQQAGAVAHERNEGPRTGKGDALAWLLRRVLDGSCDAVMVFDSDTRVEGSFLRVMNARLEAGAQVIQGQHIISNPEDGWFPALTRAMFLVDNRFQNLGRTNLGWSAKNMGDSICFRAEVLQKLGWGKGLTEDYQMRQLLLMEGTKIIYEPAARGYGEAPRSWLQARAQRARWLRGTREASRPLARRLLLDGLKRRDLALIDGALQAYLPSFSTVTVISAALFLAQLLINGYFGPVFPPGLVWAWGGVLGVLFIYPLAGLALERAPASAYLVMLTGPVFVVWRTWLALSARYGRRGVTWVRTAHGDAR